MQYFLNYRAHVALFVNLFSKIAFVKLTQNDACSYSQLEQFSGALTQLTIETPERRHGGALVLLKFHNEELLGTWWLKVNCFLAVDEQLWGSRTLPKENF